MSDDVLLVEKDGAVATVTLNRPERLNSFDAALKSALTMAVGELNDDTDVRVVILRGAGRGFSSGADLRSLDGEPASFVLERGYKPFLTGIAMSDKIWIAQIHGAAAGVGAALAMTCDLAVMAEDAYIYMAFAAIGLIPDGGNTQLLLNAMGYRRALETIIEGGKIPASDCLAYGIANKVVAAGDLETETRAWAERLTKQAPLAMASAKYLLRQVGGMSFGDAISAESREQTRLMQTADCREGVTAFVEKRAPVFRGE